jgi:hypothetical protein
VVTLYKPKKIGALLKTASFVVVVFVFEKTTTTNAPLKIASH